jgi:hypothetical protein
LTGRDGQIGQDGDLLVHQVVDDRRQASSPSAAAGRTSARLVSDPKESITWTQVPTAIRPAARRHRLGPGAGSRGDPLADLAV